LWYQVDGTDKDPATFFYYMGLAANIASPRRRKPLPLLTPEYLPDLSAFAARYFDNLCKRLPAPAVLVFDNIHETDGDPDFYRLLHHGVMRIPHGFTAILISRHKPPPVFGRMLANREMAVVGWDELRLTQNEAHDIIRMRAVDAAPRKHVREFHRAADGWAAGLALLLEWARRTKVEPDTLRKATPEEILEYFGYEIFAKLDRQTQRFLLRTAFLPRMTAKMAEEVTGLVSAGEILSRLSDRSNFTERRFRGEPVYQYHPLFRDFLLAHGKRVFTTANLSAHRRRAAAVLAGAGEADGAAMLLADARDWDALTSLILNNAPTLAARGQHRALESWLSRVPAAAVARAPWLQYWQGAVTMPYAPSAARPRFEQAFVGFRACGDAMGVFLSWDGVVNAIVHGHEDFASLDRWIGALDDLVATRVEPPSSEIAARVAATMVTALVFRQPWREDLENWASRALSPHEPGALFARLQTWWALVYHGVHMGDMAKAAAALHQLRQVVKAPGCPALGRITAALAEAAYLQLIGEHEATKQTVLDGLETARREGIRFMDHVLLGLAVASALDTNDERQARQWLAEMESALPAHQPFSTSFYHLLKCRDALIRSEFRAALAQGDLAVRQLHAVGSPFQLSYALILKGRSLHALDQDGEAAACLAEAGASAARTSSRWAAFHLRLAEAEFCFDRDQDADGLRILRDALALGKEVGYATLLDIPANTARLCVRALEAGIEGPYVQELIRKRNLTTDEPPYHLETWPWRLRMYTLGGFRLEGADRPLMHPGKAQKMPLLLCKALISLGGKDVPAERVSDILWPDADGDAAHNAFTTTLSRLRDLVGADRAIRVQDGRVTLDPRYCWVDAWAFESLLEKARASWRALRPGPGGDVAKTQDLDALARKALGLYRGHFLPADEAHVWTASCRERLRVKFVRLVERWGERLEREGQWLEAADVYERGLDADDLTEEFYQRLMVCYGRLGLRAEALATYDRCRKVLGASLGVSPAPGTEAIHRSLQS
jgi:ATP/maltotriose-dependent transcriptional regulator MalT/DNA-binding SARP family transcriptional activator